MFCGCTHVGHVIDWQLSKGLFSRFCSGVLQIDFGQPTVASEVVPFRSFGFAFAHEV